MQIDQKSMTDPTKRALTFEDLIPGRYLIQGKKTYCRCQNCWKVIQINKFFFGDLHVCY